VKSWRLLFDARLPRAVQTLQLGGLCNAFGNGVVLPFTLIYLHNVRSIWLTAAGLVLATNAVVALVSGPFSGPLVDRLGGSGGSHWRCCCWQPGSAPTCSSTARGRHVSPPRSPASATASSGPRNRP
jgi:MFS family permease